MKGHNVSVIVYIKPTVTSDGSEDIGASLNKVPGVRRARMSRRTASIAHVDYDPLATDSRQILSSVRDRGYRAVLVGM